MATVMLEGSERTPLHNARIVAPADPTERLEVTVLVRRRASAELRTQAAALAFTGPSAAQPLSREQFAQQYGADLADLAAVRAFASGHGLVVVQEHASRRTVILSGTVAQFSAAFAVQLQLYQYPDGSYRGRTGAIQLPAELDGIVEAVLGLDNRPQARAHFRVRTPRPARAARLSRTASTKRGRDSRGKLVRRAAQRHRQAPQVSYTPTKLALLYGFPSGTGKAQCVAIIELGGGFRPADLTSYFAGLRGPAPKVSAVSVDHGRNAPTGDANGPDGEVMLDIEVVGAIAPAASIAVYFAPNTDAGFLDAVTTAIHDTTHKPGVISISWGGPESSWTAQAMKAMDDAFQAAATMGITVCVASGDNGSSDGVADGGDHVDFPASSPFALACGGTSLRTRRQAIGSEVVWNDGANRGASGGGISAFFPAPTWQAGIVATRTGGASAALTTRGVPDVAGDADPETGYDVLIDGKEAVIGGTSAVAPLWAGLIARINQGIASPVGYLNPLLYNNPKALRDITQGNNGDFEATTGWDACAGLGSPIGSAIAALLKARARRGR